MRTRISFVIPILLAIGTAMATGVHAEIYKYVDKEGRITYSNSPMKGAKKLYLDPPSAPSKAKVSTPENFPRVDSRVQKERDLGRRKILEDELAAEEKLLADARQALKEGEGNPETFKTSRVITGKDGKPATVTETRHNVAKYDEKIKKLQDGVALHEKNIVALKKELANMPAL